jgi:hypothetical protein
MGRMAERRIKIVIDPAQAQDGARRVKSSFEDIGRSAGDASRLMDKARLSLLGLVAGGGALAAATLKIVRHASALEQAAKQAGLTAERYQTLSRGLSQLGIPVAQTDQALQRLTKTLGDVQSGAASKGVIAAFDKMGITSRILSGEINTTSGLFDAVAKSSSRFGTQAQFTSAASAALGEEFGRLARAISDGGGALARQEEQLRSAGDVIRDDYVRALSDAEKQVDAFTTSVGNKITIWAGIAVTELQRVARNFEITRNASTVQGESYLGGLVRTRRRLPKGGRGSGRSPVGSQFRFETDGPGNGTPTSTGGGGAIGGIADSYARQAAAAAKAAKIREAALNAEIKALEKIADYAADLRDIAERLAKTGEEFDRKFAAFQSGNPFASKPISIFDTEGIGPDALQATAEKYLKQVDLGVLGKEVASGFRSEGLLAAEAIGQVIGGKLGDSVSKVAAILQGLSYGDFTGLGGRTGGLLTLLAQRGGASGKQGVSALTEGVREAFRQPVKSFKESGDLLRDAFKSGGGLEKVLGKAGGGAATGAAIAGIGNAIGLKLNETGAAIGGAIGSFIPIPGGEIIGSIIGGLLGGLGPTPRAYSNLNTDASGNILVSSGGARGSKQNENKAAAAQAAGSVSKALSSILDAVGGNLKPGSVLGTIGPVGSQFGYATTGAVNGSNKSLIKFDTAEQAAEALIKSVFSRGLVQGIDSFTQRVLTSGKALEQSVDLAARYKTALDLLNEKEDPLGTAAKKATREFDDLIKDMKAFGATAEELSKVEKLRGIAVKEALDSQLSGLRDFQSALSGAGSGETSLSRLSRALTDYGTQKSLIGQAGFDQSAFTRLGQEVFGLARDVYGQTSSQFQDIRSQLIADTSGAISATETAFEAASRANQPVVSAIDTQTQVAVQQYQQLGILVQQNVASIDLLKQIVANIGSGGGSGNVNGAVKAAAR